MLFGIPPETQYDLRFSLLGIPVRVHPFFWLVSLIMGWDRDPKVVVLWVIAVFLSILIHEMGHAVMIRYFGWSPSVILYSFGGLATYNPSWGSSGTSFNRNQNSSWVQIIISFAGPAAGFILAGIVIVGLIAGGLTVQANFFGVDLNLGGANPFNNIYLRIFILFLLYINIFWGLINLVPVYPLDGGKISREICLMISTRDGLRASLIISIIAAGLIAFLAFRMEQPFLAIMFAMLGFSSYQQLQGSSFGGGRPW